MVRADDTEMPTVERRQGAHAEALCQRDDGCVNCPQWEIAVLPYELGDSEPITGRHRLDRQRPTRQVAEEADLGFGPESCREQVRDFGDGQNGNEERPGMRLEECPASRMVTIVSVNVGVERAGVDESAYRRTSAARISSTRSETSSSPLRPNPAARSRRRPPTFK